MKYQSIVPLNPGLLLLAAALTVSSCSTSSANREFRVRRGVVDVTVAAKGKVEPWREVRITAKMMGRIKRILVNEGDRVVKGQLIVEMEDDELRAQLGQAQARLEQAKAKLAEVDAGPREQELEAARARLKETGAVLDEAQATLKRYRGLREVGVISDAQLDEAEKRHQVAAARYRTASERLSLVQAGARKEARKVARAAVKQAEADVAHVQTLFDNTRVRAPISGKVLWRYMEPGEVIVMQRPQPILTLVDLSRVIVRAEIDESEIQKVRVGQEAVVTADAYPGVQFNGKVLDIAASVGKKGITGETPGEMLDVKVMEAKIELPREAALKLGLTVDVAITILRKEDIPIIPQKAIDEKNGEALVTIRNGDSYEVRKVVRGAEDDRYVEVVDGLEEGDVVMIRR
ncbi:MAG: HlyD family secretion protein [Acidobacteriota bacterium]